MTAESKEEDDMTPEERLAWLRDRGIQITTPEERKAGQIANALQDADSMSAREPITFILIPADNSQPLQELSVIPASVSRSLNSNGDVLVEHLKSAFVGKDVDISLLQTQSTHMLAGGSSDLAKVSDSTLRQVASEASVEVFTLVHPSPANNFTGVNIYLDEVGMLKRLPLNRRASEFARRAGFEPPPQFYGNVFLGRVQRQQQRSNTVRNLSMKLGADTAMDAPWLQAATNQNLNYQQEINSATGLSTTQPSVAGTGSSKQENDFSWTQTEEELEIAVDVPIDIQKKDVKIKFLPNRLQVIVNGKETATIALFERIDTDSCTWTLEKHETGGRLVLTMEKAESALWPRIIN